MPYFALTGQTVTDPSPTDLMNSVTVPHDQQHALANNEVGRIGAFFTTVASPFNRIQLGEVADHTSPTISSTGPDDADINILINPKGHGIVGIDVAVPTQKLTIGNGNLAFTQLAPPAVAGLAANADSTTGQLAAGVYSYVVTFTVAGGETAYGTLGNVTTDAAHTSVTVTMPTVVSDVINWKIYRSVVNGTSTGPFYLVATLTTATTTYVDKATDASILTHTVAPSISTAGGVVYIGSNRVQVIDANNLFMGQNAGAAVTNGAQNVLLGAAVAPSMTLGSHNAFVGYAAGNAATTGSENTLLGFEAGVAVTTGSGNTAVGTQSGQAITTGSNNSSLGFNAGGANTTGSNNTSVGMNAGNTDGTVSTPNNLSNATAIGYNAQVTASNSLVLGGTGSFAVSVGIGKTSPGATLHVAASSASAKIAIIQAAASQSANMQEWQSSGGTALSAVNSSGQFVMATSAGTPTGTPANGTMVFDTTNSKIWVYNGTWKGVVVS